MSKPNTEIVDESKEKVDTVLNEPLTKIVDEPKEKGDKGLNEITKSFDIKVEEEVKRRMIASGVVKESEDVPSLRLPGHFVMLTTDGSKDGKKREGGIGIKTGDNWAWLTYTDVKKIIDMCNVCKVQFNHQLELERSRVTVKDL